MSKITFTELMLEAPDTQLSEAAKALIASKWKEGPTALQLLEVLDFCTHTAEASEAAMEAMNVMLHMRIKDEGTTYEELVKKAVWRLNVDQG